MVQQHMQDCCASCGTRMLSTEPHLGCFTAFLAPLSCSEGAIATLSLVRARSCLSQIPGCSRGRSVRSFWRAACGSRLMFLTRIGAYLPRTI